MKCRVIAEKLMYLITEQPIAAIDRNISYWAKRIYGRIFLGSHVPIALQKFYEQPGVIAVKSPLILDPTWDETEDE